MIRHLVRGDLCDKNCIDLVNNRKQYLSKYRSDWFTRSQSTRLHCGILAYPQGFYRVKTALQFTMQD